MASSYILIAALVISIFTIVVFLVSIVNNTNRIRYRTADTLTTIIYQIMLLDITGIFLIGASAALIIFSLQVQSYGFALQLPGGTNFCLNRIEINTFANEALSTIIDLVLLQAIADRMTTARIKTRIQISSILIVFIRATTGFIATLNMKATTTSIFDNALITACLVQISLGNALLVATSALDIVLAISSMAVFFSKAMSKVTGLGATRDSAFRCSVSSLVFHIFRISFEIGSVVFPDLPITTQQQLYAFFSLGIAVLLALVGLAFADSMDPKFLDRVAMATSRSSFRGKEKTQTARSSFWGDNSLRARSMFWDRLSKESLSLSGFNFKDVHIRKPSKAATDNKPPLRIDTQRRGRHRATAVNGAADISEPTLQQRCLHDITPLQGTMTIEHPITKVRISKARQGRPPPTPGPSGPRKLPLAHRQELPPMPSIPEKFRSRPRPKEMNRVASSLVDESRSGTSLPRGDSPTLTHHNPKKEDQGQDEHQITIAFAGIDGAGSTPSNSHRGSLGQTSLTECLPPVQYPTIDLSTPSGLPPTGPLPPTPSEMPTQRTFEPRQLSLSGYTSYATLVSRSMYSLAPSGRAPLRGPRIFAMGDGTISIGQVMLQPVRINGAQRVIQPSRFVEVQGRGMGQGQGRGRGTVFKNKTREQDFS